MAMVKVWQNAMKWLNYSLNSYQSEVLIFRVNLLAMSTEIDPGGNGINFAQFTSIAVPRHRNLISSWICCGRPTSCSCNCNLACERSDLHANTKFFISWPMELKLFNVIDTHWRFGNTPDVTASDRLTMSDLESAVKSIPSVCKGRTGLWPELFGSISLTVFVKWLIDIRSMCTCGKFPEYNHLHTLSTSSWLKSQLIMLNCSRVGNPGSSFPSKRWTKEPVSELPSRTICLILKQ